MSILPWSLNLALKLPILITIHSLQRERMALFKCMRHLVLLHMYCLDGNEFGNQPAEVDGLTLQTETWGPTA